VPVTTQDLALQVRRGVGDWGAYLMSLQTAMSDSATVIDPLPNSTEYLRAGQILNVDVEDIELTEPLGSPSTVIRARRGTAATTHALGAQVLLAPRFTNQKIVDALNEALRVLGGRVPNVQVSTTITTAANIEEYTLPTDCVAIYLVEMERSTSGMYRPWRTWDHSFATGKLRLLGRFATGRAIRLTYHADWTELDWDTADVSVPSRYHGFLVDYAIGDLLLWEATQKAAVVGAATGDSSSVRESLIAAQTLKSTAEAKLERVAPPTRIVQLRDKRSQRL